jgi:hypothetical protein
MEGRKYAHVLVWMACFKNWKKKHHFKSAKGWTFEGLHLPSFEGHHVQVH